MSDEIQQDEQAPRVYIASGLDNAGAVSLLRDQLRLEGVLTTYDWTKHGSVQHLGPQAIRATARAELQGIDDADLVLVMLPGGRGTHWEAGYALGRGKIVLIVAPDWKTLTDAQGRECAFYRHPDARLLIGSIGHGMLAQVVRALVFEARRAKESRR